jgi:hypothetical protein
MMPGRYLDRNVIQTYHIAVQVKITLGMKTVPVKIRGVSFEENLNNAMGLGFNNLSHLRVLPVELDRGDGCVIRLVAVLEPKGAYRIETGEKFA